MKANARIKATTANRLTTFVFTDHCSSSEYRLGLPYFDHGHRLQANQPNAANSKIYRDREQ